MHYEKVVHWFGRLQGIYPGVLGMILCGNVRSARCCGGILLAIVYIWKNIATVSSYLNSGNMS